jgi:hypothetical protein
MSAYRFKGSKADFTASVAAFRAARVAETAARADYEPDELARARAASDAACEAARRQRASLCQHDRDILLLPRREAVTFDI